MTTDRDDSPHPVATKQQRRIVRSFTSAEGRGTGAAAWGTKEGAGCNGGKEEIRGLYGRAVARGAKA
jgi:hypothetical protein